MQYRILGHTGIRVSSLSFGASSLGGVFHRVSTADGIRTVRAALDHGINLVDCSPYYGDKKAEEVLGIAIGEIPRDTYLLSTKVGRYWQNGKKYWDYSGERVVKSVEESLARLKSDHIDFIHCHDIEFADPLQIVNETLPALQKLKETGKVRFLGITGLPLQNLKDVIDNSPGLVEMVLTFCHYTLQDDSLLDYLDHFDEKKVAVINASPLAMGLLSERGAPDWHPADESLREKCREAADFCRTQGEKIEKLAIQYTVNHPGIPTTLVGTANPDTIVRNIGWTEGAIDNELLQRVLDILQPVRRKTWKNS